jgi:hypothetical protein
MGIGGRCWETGRWFSLQIAAVPVAVGYKYSIAPVRTMILGTAGA